MDQERVVGSAYWDLRQSRLISRDSGVGYTWPSSSSTAHETGFLISFFFFFCKMGMMDLLTERLSSLDRPRAGKSDGSATTLTSAGEAGYPD